MPSTQTEKEQFQCVPADFLSPDLLDRGEAGRPAEKQVQKRSQTGSGEKEVANEEMSLLARAQDPSRFGKTLAVCLRGSTCPA